MTTTTVSIGADQSIGSTVTPDSCSGSGPYVVTFTSTPSSSVAVGDIYFAYDESSYMGWFYYLLTDISGSNYTLEYLFCDDEGMESCSEESPCNLFNSMFQTAAGTFKRAFSTITLFEVEVNNASPTYWGSTDDVIGECHADNETGFDENDIIFDNKQSLASVTLTVYPEDRHMGHAENGVFIKPTTRGTHGNSSTLGGVIRVGIDNMTIEWLDISLASVPNASGGTYAQNMAIRIVGNNIDDLIIRNNLLHDCEGDKGTAGPSGISAGTDGGAGNTWSILNNIVYNFIEGSNDSAAGLMFRKFRGTLNVYNNTVYKITANGGSKDATGLKCGYYTNNVPNIKNNIVAGLTASDQKHAFTIESNVSSYSVGTNLSDDTADAAETAQTMGRAYNTTVNPGALVGKTLVEIAFVNTVGGSEDLHLAAGSVCREAGTDIGTTNGVNIDINGVDRNATDVTWDMGAHQASVVESSTSGKALLMFLDI